jgi:transcriptional regulator with XRE-family HTH domain
MPGFKTRGFADIGPALRFLRLHGPSAPSKQKEVAARAAVTKGMLSSYERGGFSPNSIHIDADFEFIETPLVILFFEPPSQDYTKES